MFPICGRRWINDGIKGQERQGYLPPAEEGDELGLEPRSVVGDVFAGRLADEEHLPQVAFGHGVAFEAILLRVETLCSQ